MFKKILLAALLTLTPISAFATYDFGKPDCSKTSAYLDDLNKEGFIPLLEIDDVIHQPVNHILAYNPKTHEIVFLSKKDDKICVNYLGSNTKLTPKSEQSEIWRSFLDDTFHTTSDALKGN